VICCKVRKCRRSGGSYIFKGASMVGRPTRAKAHGTKRERARSELQLHKGHVRQERRQFLRAVTGTTGARRPRRRRSRTRRRGSTPNARHLDEPDHQRCRVSRAATGDGRERRPACLFGARRRPLDPDQCGDALVLAYRPWLVLPGRQRQSPAQPQQIMLTSR
jgi:hypothetical protein